MAAHQAGPVGALELGLTDACRAGAREVSVSMWAIRPGGRAPGLRRETRPRAGRAPHLVTRRSTSTSSSTSSATTGPRNMHDMVANWCPVARRAQPAVLRRVGTSARPGAGRGREHVGARRVGRAGRQFAHELGAPLLHGPSLIRAELGNGGCGGGGAGARPDPETRTVDLVDRGADGGRGEGGCMPTNRRRWRWAGPGRQPRAAGPAGPGIGPRGPAGAAAVGCLPVAMGSTSRSAS